MKKIFTIALLLSVCVSYNHAQTDSSDLKKFPAQVTFFYPLGIHGLDSYQYEYQFSLNLLVGRTGGINGFEAAGWMNLNDEYVKGFQAAGIGNICNGPIDGFQASGIFNLVNNDFHGFQAAGIVSINNGYTRAGQFSGIASAAMGVYGVQGSGIVSASGDHVTGAQLSGIANATTSIKGVQIAGITNAAVEVNGAQVAGIANIAKNVKGTQIAGIINICDSIDGIPLALISIVRENGYRKLELATTESEYGRIAFKTGVRRFYTLFSLGYYNNSQDYNVTFGGGIGTSILMKKQKSAINVEWRLSQISKDFEVNETILLNTWIIDYSLILFDRMEIFAGPSANMLITSNSSTAAMVAPSWAMAFKGNNRIWGWAGFHAGLRF